MDEEFVPYNIVKKLEKIDFCGPAIGLYYYAGKKLYFGNGVFTSRKHESKLAPLYSEVFRWFREEHNIHAEITWSPSYEYDSGEWSDAIYEITFVDVSYTKELKAESPDMQRSNGKQLTYEGAQLECLNMLIEIVKNK